MKNVVSFSGGRTSAYLVYKIKEIYGDNADYVFMDTGAEHPETYKFVKKVAEEFNIKLTCLRTVVHEMGKGCTYKIVSIDDCKPDLVPFSNIIKKYGVPKNHMPHCTLHMKTSPYKTYCDEKYGKGNYITWLGIRADEPRRIKKREGIRYLAEISDFDSDDVLFWWEKQSFDLGFDINSGWLGNCVFCIKKGDSKLALAAADEPEFLKKFDNMVNSPEARQLGYTEKNQLYRGGKTIHDIIKSYEIISRDELIYRMRHSKRFENSVCGESCEVFSEQIEIDLEK